MLQRLGTFTLALALALGAAVALDSGEAFALEVGDPAPDFSCSEWVNGEAANLDALRGRVVMIEFWAWW